MIQNSSVRLDTYAAIAAAKRYSLYKRGPVWYVHCMGAAPGKQHRISTGHSDREAAVRFVERCRESPAEINCTTMEARLWKKIENARLRAAKKRVPFAVGRDDLRALLLRSGGRCELTGVPFQAKGAFQPSLDRIKPSAGYVAGNIRLVCLVTNTAMLHYGEDAFRTIAQAYCQKNAGLI